MANSKIKTKFAKENITTMARPIKETPILFGDEARRFQLRMLQKRSESPKRREERLRNYAEVCEWMERGKDFKLPTRA